MRARVPHLTVDDERRKELGRFLAACRRRARALDGELPQQRRRRVAGLRRAEVAELAGISTSWYTAVEQGLAPNVSLRVVTALAKALRLCEDEAKHLARLAGYAMPEETAVRGDGFERLVERLVPLPAFVLELDWTVVSANEPAQRLFRVDARADGFARNHLWRMFRDPYLRSLYQDWDVVARSFVAFLQRAMAAAPGNERLQRLVDELLRTSAEFAAHFPKREIVQPCDGVCSYRHPEIGTVRLRPFVMRADASSLSVVVFSPETEDDARAVDGLSLASRGAGRTRSAS